MYIESAGMAIKIKKTRRRNKYLGEIISRTYMREYMYFSNIEIRDSLVNKSGVGCGEMENLCI